MMDKWFLEEIDKQLERRQRVVVVDPSASCAFLIKLAEQKGYTVLYTDPNLKEEWQRVKEELFLRYKAEKEHQNDNVIFYVVRDKDKLSFLFDYCFTHGCVDFTHPSEWIKKRLFSATGMQVTMDDHLLITAAKLSIDKDIAWWKKILQNLEELISLEEELIPFLSDPLKYFRDKDKDVKRLFEEKLFELLEQPYTEKPPQILAKEVVNLLFEQLLNNAVNPQLFYIYHKWLDSNTYAGKLYQYIDNYNIDSSVNIWNVHPDHCFTKIDREQLEEIALNFRNYNFVAEKLEKIKQRLRSQIVKHIVPEWWKDVITIFEFDTKPLNACKSLQEVIDFYVTSFHCVDRAIRHLYVYFINEEKIIRPLQEYYESINKELLDHWFEFIAEYKSNQQGFLVELFENADPKMAVIVGDGLRYEIAEAVAEYLKNNEGLHIEKSVMLAGVPSETEHNMSALYTKSGETIKLQKERESKLLEESGKTITFLDMEKLNYSIEDDYLVLTYKDIDSAGEKMQLGALKLFDEFENVLIEKIKLLTKMNYRVHLVADHGFVVTGLLDESDKIKADAKGIKEVHERYIRTLEKQNRPDWLEFEEKCDKYNYIYVAKNHRPFKSVSTYGFSHGGITPQEVLVPNFVFEMKPIVEGLKVKILNKNDLKEVTGEFFGIKVIASSERNNLFSASREIQLLLYANNINYCSSNFVKIKAGETESFEFSFEGHKTIKAVLVDADTRELLDDVEIKKSSARDLGELF